MDVNTLHITRKELFYSAYMLNIRKLINVVYEFPADEDKFEAELEEVKLSLRKKKLLKDSARDGSSIGVTVLLCLAFCSSPIDYEIIDSDGYYATIYNVLGFRMLMERLSSDDFSVSWHTDKAELDEYIQHQLAIAKGE